MEEIKRQRRISSWEGSLTHDVLQLWGYLNPRRHRQLVYLLVLLLLTSLSEMVSVGAIFPFLTALGNADTLLNSPSLQSVLEVLEIETTLQLVRALGLAFIIIVLLANSLRLVTLNTRARLAAAIGADISSRVYYTTLRQPYSFHISHNSSDLVQTLTIDTERLTNNILTSLLLLLSNALLIPALFITLLLIDGRIALGCAVILGGTYTLIYFARRHLLKRNSKIISQSSQQKIKVVQEGIGGIRDVLLGNSQNFFDSMYKQAEVSFKQTIAANLVISHAPVYVVESLALCSIVLLALGLGQDDDFSKAIPVLGSLALGAKKLLPALQQLFSSLAKIQGSRASLRRVLVALNRPIDPLTVNPSTFQLKLERGIEFEHIWFRYSDKTDWVLRDLNLIIKPKTTVGIVGITGSGKSTTVDMILGLLKPSKGVILLDGVPLEGDRLRQWQQNIAHVPQSIFLSDGTIAENIAFGFPKAQIDFAKVQKSAYLAQIADFINNLPDGYDTYVGERGIRLSGGQRQRIGIARALYQQASVIVFDEATSALDSTTEKEVMAAIDALSGEFTILLIAHRFSTLARCDWVLELSHGQVVFQGSYRELMQKSLNV